MTSDTAYRVFDLLNAEVVWWPVLWRAGWLRFSLSCHTRWNYLRVTIVLLIFSFAFSLAPLFSRIVESKQSWDMIDSSVWSLSGGFLFLRPKLNHPSESVYRFRIIVVHRFNWRSQHQSLSCLRLTTNLAQKREQKRDRNMARRVCVPFLTSSFALNLMSCITG